MRKPTPGKPPFGWLDEAAYRRMPLAERALLWAAYFADVVKPREVPMDSNRGQWVEEFQAAAGTTPGNPWCASFVTYAAYKAGMIDAPTNPASVYGWATYGVREHVVIPTESPIRGDLFFWLNPDHHGHIGFVVKTGKLGPLRWIETIEGNAQPGEQGNQREGGGVYRRKRIWTRKLRFLRLVGS